MEIIEIKTNSISKSDVTNEKVNKPIGTLYFETQQEAAAYTDLSKWGDGTTCYTKTLSVGVLHNGTWNWA